MSKGLMRLLFAIGLILIVLLVMTTIWTNVLNDEGREVATNVLVVTFFALLAMHQLWILAFVRFLADHEFFITTVEENTAKAILKARKAWRIITPDPETDPDENGNILPRDNQPCSNPSGRLRNKKGFESPWVEWIDRQLPHGIRWVGLPFLYSTYWYNFRWMQQRESKPQETEDGLVSAEELNNEKYVAAFAKKINYVYLRDAVYASGLKGAETSELMAIDIQMNVTVRVVNPYLTLFQVHDWLETILDLIRPGVRTWVKGHTYEQVCAKQEVAERENDVFLQQTGLPEGVAPVQGKEPQTFAQYIECTYGVRIKRIAFDEIVPPEEYQKAATRRVEANQEKIRIQTLAEAEANKITTLAEADRKATETRLEVYAGHNKDVAVRLEELRTIQIAGENGNTILVGGLQTPQLILAGGKTLLAGSSEKEKK